DLFEELGSLGYFGIMYPERYGGLGSKAPYTYFTILCDELAAASMGFAATVCMHASTATHTIFKWGGEELRQRYLVPAIQGRKVGAFAITEPDAGSDAAAIRTRATKVEGGYRLKGAKMFTSNAIVADFITIAATVDPGKGVRHRVQPLRHANQHVAGGAVQARGHADATGTRLAILLSSRQDGRRGHEYHATRGPCEDDRCRRLQPDMSKGAKRIRRLWADDGISRSALSARFLYSDDRRGNQRHHATDRKSATLALSRRGSDRLIS